MFAKQIRLILSLVSLTFGVGIVFISLSAASPVVSATDKVTATQRRFYMGETILPDHLAYPALMIIDRVELETAPPQKRLELQVEYAFRRLQYTRQLLDRGQPEMALTTLTKSQKYMINAGQEALSVETSAEMRQQLIAVLHTYCQQVLEVNSSFSDSQRVVVDRLIAEMETVESQLHQSIASDE